ncbi:hypothetical protein L596_011809 [Steinernema carpocapsae]|uniref:Strictosidine synthase conserved region domain-containing protein n=1 Tax=Steinernema carpocapsae TaxID=34508 RepID=A0A4U5NV47_STECR|nr:hypothetical protein L596_011809 [Steinernema carpocapsae]
MNPFCKTLNPRNCFRPLGMRRLNSKELIVADAYQGLYTVNMEEMSFKRILEANMLIDGEPMKFADDVDVIDEENVILSDASTRFTYHETIVDFNEGVPSGRVLHVNLRTKNVRVLTHGLYFANGVQLFPDKKSFLVCESLSGRVHRVYLEGEKKGKREVFVEGLPGIPDNVRLGKDGTFWVALAKARHPDKFDFAHFLKPHPMLRRLLISLFPHSWIYKATLLPTFAMIVQVSQTGEILSSLQDPTGSVVKGITQVTDDGEFLYLGSFYIDYVARVKK